MASMTEARLQHFWDGKGLLVRGYKPVLALAEDAWDIYMIYGADARWDGDAPPKPLFWMHQLGDPDDPRVTSAPFLDAREFAKRMQRTVAEKK
jgi:hypothetical protein